MDSLLRGRLGGVVENLCKGISGVEDDCAVWLGGGMGGGLAGGGGISLSILILVLLIICLVHGLIFQPFLLL